jgi:hypothetical protein
MRHPYLALSLLLCLLASPALAVPTITAKPTYSAANGGMMWEIQITQDGDDSLATELPITLSGFTPSFTTFLNDAAGGDKTNGPANATWYYNETAAGSGTVIWNTTGNPTAPANETQNTGNNPFTGTITEGLQIDSANKRLFAALGSSINLPDADAVAVGRQVATLHILTSDGQLNWSNAIVAENGTKHTITGKAGSVIRGDMNGSGTRNFLDVAPIGLALSNPAIYPGQFPGLDRVARGDMNGNGALNFLDIAAFGSCLSNPATCPMNPMVGSGSGAEAFSGGASIAVPEPASFVLILLSAIAAGVRRR